MDLKILVSMVSKRPDVYFGVGRGLKGIPIIAIRQQSSIWTDVKSAKREVFDVLSNHFRNKNYSPCWKKLGLIFSDEENDHEQKTQYLLDYNNMSQIALDVIPKELINKLISATSKAHLTN
jgi:hypothetical protein